LQYTFWETTTAENWWKT